jgi:hypothetical protein
VHQPDRHHRQERAQQRAVEKRLVIGDDQQLVVALQAAMHLDPEQQSEDEPGEGF